MDSSRGILVCLSSSVPVSLFCLSEFGFSIFESHFPSSYLHQWNLRIRLHNNQPAPATTSFMLCILRIYFQGTKVTNTLDIPDQMEQHCTPSSAVSSRLLPGKPLDLHLSKQDFTIVLLRSLGPANVSSAVVNDIFEQIDEDKDGSINAAELSNFLQSKEYGKFSDFMTKRLVHAPNVGSSMFVCGSSLSMLNNIWKRSHELEGIMLFVPHMIMWLFFIGSALFAFDFLRTTIKRQKDEGVILTMQLLRKNFGSVEQVSSLV